MIQLGKSITQYQDRLDAIDLSVMVSMIKYPELETLELIKKLRLAKNISIDNYNQLKKRLPYFVCGTFNPAIRRKENFGYIEFFIVDIDHIIEKGLNIDHLRLRLASDPRVCVLFTSPGEDGLKVMFRLKERCYDHSIYSIFYKLFLKNLADEYGVDQVIDSKTSDVTRACFVSYDPNVYFNPDPVTISISSFVDVSNPISIIDLNSELDDIVDFAESESCVKEQGLSDDIYQSIRERLNPKAKKIDNRNIFVPDQLNSILGELSNHLEKAGFSIVGAIDINYGKKLKLGYGVKRAEINLFYGKKGFTIVESPKSGTCSELNR
ncbi:MAG: CRISPR-associated primase-polymerase type B, partial [Bacteroidales bacterium]